MYTETTYRIFAMGIFLVGALISGYFRRKADRETGEKISPIAEGLPILIALRIFGLILWGSILAYLINPAWMTWSQLELPASFRWFGVVLGLLADLFAWWIFSSLGNNVSPTVATRRSHQLVTNGPYRWIRHPLYLMGLIAYLGFAFLSANWIIACLAVLVFILLLIRLPQEEAHLAARFGEEYLSYSRRTGRFLPRLRPQGGTQ